MCICNCVQHTKVVIILQCCRGFLGAVDEEGKKPFYAEDCASMLAVTFSSGGPRSRSIVSPTESNTYIVTGASLVLFLSYRTL